MKVVKEKPKRLTPELAEQFGQLVAKRKQLEEEEVALKPKIKKLICKSAEVEVSSKKGKQGKVKTYTYAPKQSPYAIVYSEFQGVDVSWKQEFARLYKKLYGPRKFKRFVDNLETKDCDKLEPKPNPNHKG